MFLDPVLPKFSRWRVTKTVVHAPSRNRRSGALRLRLRGSCQFSFVLKRPSARAFWARIGGNSGVPIVGVATGNWQLERGVLHGVA